MKINKFKMDNHFPREVYKYRDWNNVHHQSALIQRQIYMASPADFNDPFDCQITPNFSMLNTEEKLKAYTNKVLIDTRNNWLNGEEDPIKKMIEFEDRLSDVVKFQKEYDESIGPINNKHYGVLSLSTEWDNLLLWSHYANKHQGFCVGYNEAILRELVFDRSKGGKVIYGKEYPNIDPLMDEKIRRMFLQTHFKSEVWSYEKEYRISKLFYPEIPDSDSRKIILSEEAFLDVTLGLNIPINHKKAILEICRAKNIPVFQTSKINYRFEITRERIF